ncbi:MAG: hypothetical protein KKA12_10275, partial [Alphaproteobacteria bacterium]|nr:hypothetical protein [Alphaproteobacteria bacterium]
IENTLSGWPGGGAGWCRKPLADAKGAPNQNSGGGAGWCRKERPEGLSALIKRFGLVPQGQTGGLGRTKQKRTNQTITA